MKDDYVKTVLINRAVPGSGKTTFSRRIYEAVAGAGLSIAVHSTDDFFMVDGTYLFDLTLLGEYHRKNYEHFVESLRGGVDLVVVDNTNIAPWETEPYTRAARAAGYRIVLFNFLPRALEKHLAAQQVTPEKPDAHEVPADVLERFIADFRLYDDLLDPAFKADPAVHVDRMWDDAALCARPLDTPAVPFDYDVLLVIAPDDYHQLKEKIGAMMLKRFMRKR